MVRAKWPWPTDTTQDRLRRIIESYRTALMEVDPQTCRLVDARMVECGQAWVCSGDTPVDVDRMMTARQISDEFGIQPWNVMDWSRRHPDQVPKHKRGVQTLFRVGDVLTFQAISSGRR